MSLLRVENIDKTFVTTRALKNAAIIVEEGEIRGLVGENGSGKSTLVSIVSGIIRPDGGRMFKNETAYAPESVLDAGREKIGIVVQEMGTIDGLTVAANLFLGEERLFKRFGLLNTANMNRRSLEVLHRYGIVNIQPDADIGALTFEDRKLVEFAKALYIDPDLLIVDETTTALSHHGREILFSELKRLKKKKRSVIFISHDLGEVIEHCDSVTVMKDGETVDTVSTRGLNEHDLKELMVGRELQHTYYREDTEASYEEEVILRVENLTLNGAYYDVSFELHRGEILGIGGLTNCGMHLLGKTLFGLKPATSGSVEVSDGNKRITNYVDAIAGGIGYLPKNRDQEGLMLLSSIRENICLPSLSSIQKRGFISPSKERKLAQYGAEQLSIKMSSINQLCLYLSGGNKQKVALSKWLVKDSDILILDCPTRGIDVAVKASIYGLMQELKKEGKAVLVISEELQELIGVSDRIIVLKAGRVKKIFERRKDLTEEEIIHFMI
ncbi:MAG: sugar ABC transporter ATP-binding protein [Spirochaetes bacterium]|nr:sugar ABC transporter ATP-binding protein [Spirochaetota bacterium]